MSRSPGLATFAALVLSVHAQDQITLADALHFEGPLDGACPGGWSCTPRETIATDGDVVHGGKWAARIERQADSAQQFSVITKSIPVDFNGKLLELRGYIRSESVRDFAAFWMREDGPTEPVGFVSMQSNQRVKGTTPWTEYSISLPVKPDARTLFFGFLLSGTGKAWADDLQLLVDGKPVWEAPKVVRPQTVLDTDHEFDSESRITINSLNAAQIDNLATLGKIWGFLKYHHPQVTAGARHFDYDLLRVLPKIIDARDRKAANDAILHWIVGLGEITACKECAKLD